MAAARLAKCFPNHDLYRSPLSCRNHIPPHSGAYSARSWFLPQTSKPGSSTHLLLDSLLHTIEFLRLSKGNFPPLPMTQPEDPTLPDDYLLLRKAINLLAVHELASIPTPTYYIPSHYTTPHPFMGLDWFTAGRIHQMRAGKSYLAAHPSWNSPPDHSTICPRCDSAPEDMKHALLECSGTSSLHLTHMPCVRSVSPSAPLWSSTPLLLELSNFIHAAGINYPPSNKRLQCWESPDRSPPPSRPPSPLLSRATPPTDPWPSDTEED